MKLFLLGIVLVGCSAASDGILRLQSKAVKLKKEYFGLVSPVVKASVAAETSGRILERNFEIGAQVKADQVLYLVEAEELQREKQRILLTIKQVEADHKFLSDRLLRRQNNPAAYPEETVQTEALALVKNRVALSSAELDLQSIEYQLGLKAIKAPFDGLISNYHKEQGEWLQPGQAVFELLSIKQWKLVVELQDKIVEQLDYCSGFKLPMLPHAVSLFQIYPKTDAHTQKTKVEFRFEGDGQSSYWGKLLTLQFEYPQKILSIPLQYIKRGLGVFQIKKREKQSWHWQDLSGVVRGQYFMPDYSSQLEGVELGLPE